MSGYCRWWNKNLEDVTEHEQVDVRKMVRIVVSALI